MEMNTALRYVLARAQSEAAYLGATDAEPAHVFLGILKISELTPGEVAPSSGHKKEIGADIEGVSSMLRENGIDSKRARGRLRDLLMRAKDSGGGAARMDGLASRAERKAESEGAQTLTCILFLECILEEPPAIIRPFLKKQDAPENGYVPETAAGPGGGQEKLAQLPGLAGRVRTLRASLLEAVYGQDHAVHQFAESIFASEVLAKADEGRKRPGGIFVFAGPPGVGKTFLAEQGAGVLGLPYKRFDMSAYADHQAHINLIGFAPSYKDAKSGVLTGFVSGNPRCILLFDEIEKAHLNTVQLFLQILDAGVLHDDYDDRDVSFRDTLIIFTTNAGQALYEGGGKADAAGIPQKVILDALGAGIDPHTGNPFFPAAILSRMATGSVILFNHLRACDLEKICGKELDRCCALFEKQYGVKAGADPMAAAALLFSEGGLADARTLRAQTELFFKREIFKLSGLFSGSGFMETLEKLDDIRFTVDSPGEGSPAAALFRNPEKHGILLLADGLARARLEEQMKEFAVHAASSVEEAFAVLGARDIAFVLLDLMFDGPGGGVPGSDPGVTLPAGGSAAPASTVYAFERVPMAAAALRGGRVFFRELRGRMPEIPVYLLETPRFKIDDELLAAFTRAGARGRLSCSGSGDLAEQLAVLSDQIYLQKTAESLAAEQKALYFDTAPRISGDRRHISIRMRDLALKRNISAGDAGEVLAEAEKPGTAFGDVIGAEGAKEELQFFVNYLRNPKKFIAQGLRPPKGVLLYGPPGTGKTLLARAMAGECGAAFLPAAASAFVTKWQGSGPEAVRSLFGRARRYSPSVIFIDEIDAIGRRRGSSSAHGEEMALNALLTEMDGFALDPKRPVFVLAATNFDLEEGQGGPGVMDPALVRRFDRAILVDMPAKEDRRRYLKMMLGKNSSCRVTDNMVEQLAGRSAGLSLANLAAVLDLAARAAVKRGVPLDDSILEESFETSLHGEKKDWGVAYMERVARHESGHALLCYMAGRTPSYLTIVARGSHGGYMEHDSAEDSPLQTKGELLGRLRTALGGRAAELVYYGEKEGLSTGAAGDLRSATQIARAMICSYGMDEETGYASLGQDEASQGPLAARITDRVSQMIKTELAASVDIIKKNAARIDRLAAALLEKNRLDRAEMEYLLK